MVIESLTHWKPESVWEDTPVSHDTCRVHTQDGRGRLGGTAEGLERGRSGLQSGSVTTGPVTSGKWPFIHSPIKQGSNTNVARGTC